MNKKLPNAPVFYALAQIQFNPVTALSNYINEVQDKLRLKGYTIFEPQKINQLRFEPGSNASPTRAELMELPIWRITKSDRTAGFVLSPSYIAFHTTHYQTHSQFFGELLFGLEIIHSVLKLDHLTRLGLRYLNAILPLNGETIESYLVDGVHGVKFTKQPSYSLNESVIDTNSKDSQFKSTLVNRVICRTGIIAYPPDILPHGLSLKPQFEKEIHTPHAIIDTDHFMEGQMQLNFAEIRTKLTFLHTHLKKAFEATMTDHAKIIWAK